MGARVSTQVTVSTDFSTNVPSSLKKPIPYKFSLSGVYKLTCPECNKAYVEQTKKCFKARYKEHQLAFRNNSHTSRFTQHLNEKAHSFGTMDNVVQILEYHKNGSHLNRIERIYIHSEYAANNHFNDNHTIFTTAIFDTLLKAR